MAASKANRFDSLLYEQSVYFKIHSHPARIQIIYYLLENGTTSYKDLCRNIPLAKETISQHLKSLRKENLIWMKEKYPYSFYSPNIKKCKQAIEKMKHFIEKMEGLIICNDPNI